MSNEKPITIETAREPRPEFLRDDQETSHVRALTRELNNYEAKGDQDRADQVRAELQRIAGEAKSAAKRSTKRGGDK